MAENPFSPEQARKVLQLAQKVRLEHCQAELNELLERHGCTLVAQPILTADGRIVANVMLVPTPKPQE